VDDRKADEQPWQNGMDFDRGEYVANLPKGEESVTEMIEELRAKVEQVRSQLGSSESSEADGRLVSCRIA
jgi:hypothetical protein